tara:strand:+ start:3985 stop:4590 length:606 start_codon:yes stop_codon:yes gene_type:complete
MKNKIGLVLSHTFVREGEDYKWEWIDNSIGKHRDIYDNFYIVLSGHGVTPPDYIIDKIDACYWDEHIQEKEIGRGHPFFCIKGYEACREAGCKKTLKNRATDWLENDSILDHDLAFCSTNTDLEKGLLGDLLIFGDTKELELLWNGRSWDYDIGCGLPNLYQNAVSIFGLDYFDKATFLDSKSFGWITPADWRGKAGYWGL